MGAQRREPSSIKRLIEGASQLSDTRRAGFQECRSRSADESDVAKAIMVRCFARCDCPRDKSTHSTTKGRQCKCRREEQSDV